MADTLTETEWRPIDEAPWQTVIEVRNPGMADPCLATRGFDTGAGVHPDNTFCTSVFTPMPGDIPFPAGRLVCPTEWRPAPTTQGSNQ